jgi:hypothetical protein
MECQPFFSQRGITGLMGGVVHLAEAIAGGGTMVRVGTALFGSRPWWHTQERRPRARTRLRRPTFPPRQDCSRTMPELQAG